jgi:hypothetical protein
MPSRRAVSETLRSQSARPAGQRRIDLVGVGRLGEVVDRAELHRSHGGRDVAVTGEDDDLGVLALLAQRLDDVEAMTVFEPEIDDRESRRARFDEAFALGHRLGGSDGKATGLHRPRQPLQEGAVVIDDQEGARRGGFDHASVPIIRSSASLVACLACI